MPAAPVRSRPQHILVTTRTFCTILSTNYLPKALALAESLRQHEDGSPQLDGVVCLNTQVLGLPERTVLERTEQVFYLDRTPT